jgi:hypothetical protein
MLSVTDHRADPPCKIGERQFDLTLAHA